MSSRGTRSSPARAPGPGSALAWAIKHPGDMGHYGDYAGHGASKRDDKAMVQIAKEVGKAGKPQVMSAAKLDAVIASGAKEVYRGFSSPIEERETVAAANARAEGFAKEYSSGVYRPGYGAYGSGFYVAHGGGALNVANTYAGFGVSGIKGGTIMRMAVLPGAKTATYNSVYKQMQTAAASYFKAHGGSQMNATDWAQYDLYYTDVGRFALSRGYDVLTQKAAGGPNNDYWLILNRGAVAVQRDLITPAPTLYSKSKK